MDRETAKETAKEMIGDYLKSKGLPLRGAFHCLNPAHTDNTPSMSFDQKHNNVHCFSCGVSYDIFDLVGMDYNITDTKEIFDKVYSLYGLQIDSPGGSDQGRTPRAKSSGKDPAKVAPAQPKKEKPKEEKPQEDYVNYYKQCRENLKEDPARAYLKSRGISEETASKYLCGYDPSYKTFNIDSEGQQKGTSWKALIIPTGRSSYVARNIETPAEPSKKNRYRKKGASLIFNNKAIYTTDSPLFVVEGEIDALSIIEAGGQAIALGSTSNYHQLVKMFENEKPEQPLILSLDTDEEGRKAEDALSAELERLQIPFYRLNISGQHKDANEALTADREGFIKEIRAAEQAPEEQKQAMLDAIKDEYLKTSAAAELDGFLDRILEAEDIPVISTGFKNLDGILDGGLYEGLYVLGAISSLGKTTLMLQMADNLAKQGHDVLIFSLEMAKKELIAKSLSRITYLDTEYRQHAKTTRGILTGSRYKNYSKDERMLIFDALGTYREYAAHIFIHEGVGDIGVQQIKETVKRHISLTGNKPIVIIDYLQILAPYDMRSSDKQNTDKAVLELKRLSRDNNIIVIGISSFNRDSYREGSGNKGKVTQADFKESGAIEYSADVLIGLEFMSAGTSGYSEKKAKKEDPRKINLVIIKNRNGKAWESAGFNYYPLFNYFEETEATEILYDFDGEPIEGDNPFEDPEKDKTKKKKTRAKK